MQIQLRTDSHTKNSSGLSDFVTGVVENAVAHLGNRVTRVEVFLSDENGGHKSADNDKRCVMEARLAGLQPIAVSHHSDSVQHALDGAAEKLEKTLKRTLGRLDNPASRPRGSDEIE
jgi:ribosome-associated translation inhibitor RaiA